MLEVLRSLSDINQGFPPSWFRYSDDRCSSSLFPWRWYPLSIPSLERISSVSSRDLLKEVPGHFFPSNLARLLRLISIILDSM